jgi:hypothetical protein
VVPEADDGLRSVDVEDRLASLGLHGELVSGLPHGVREVDDLRVEPELARREARDVGEHRRAAYESPGLPLEERHPAREPGVRGVRGVPREMAEVGRREHDAAHRVTELVGGYREESVARRDGVAELPNQLLVALALLAEAGDLDPQRGELGVERGVVAFQGHDSTRDSTSDGHGEVEVCGSASLFLPVHSRHGSSGTCRYLARLRVRP